MMDRRPPTRVTRRTWIAGAAAGSAGLASVRSARASAVPGSAFGPPGSALSGRGVFSHRLGNVGATPPPVRVSGEFSLVGVEWSGPARPRVELRVAGAAGAWSRWGLASVLGHGPDGPVERLGSPLWAGRARWVQLRSSEPLTGVRLHFVAAGAPPSGGPAGAPPSAGPAGASAAGAALAQPVLPAGSGQPPIIARDGWAHGRARPRDPAAYGAVRLAFVHHTDGLNAYSAAEVPGMIYGIFLFHRFTNGWNDIGYNFVVDRFGRIWEARAGGIDLPVVGAHAGGYNLESTGVALLGTFTDALPSGAATGALERLVAWKLALHGIPARGRVEVEVDPADAFYTPFRPGARISLPRVAGHRQGCSTDCPGNALSARLPAIRGAIQRRSGSPATLTLALPGAGGKPASFLATATATAQAGVPRALGGRLTARPGVPLSGATIEVQRIGAPALRGPDVGQAVAATIATAATDGQGRFSLPVTLAAGSMIRALHRAHPAVASELVAVSVSPRIVLTAVSTAPLVIEGVISPTVSPLPRRVVVTLAAVRTGGSGQRGLPMRRTVTPAPPGTFAVDFGARTAGSYEVTATTAETDRLAAGAATPLPVAVA